MTYRPRCIKFAFECKSENQTQGFLFDFFSDLRSNANFMQRGHRSLKLIHWKSTFFISLLSKYWLFEEKQLCIQFCRNYIVFAKIKKISSSQHICVVCFTPLYLTCNMIHNGTMFCRFSGIPAILSRWWWAKKGDSPFGHGPGSLHRKCLGHTSSFEKSSLRNLQKG